jgi:hypothetical protein
VNAAIRARRWHIKATHQTRAHQEHPNIMNPEQARAEETRAMERVVAATQQVQKAFAALQSQFPPASDGRPSQIALQTFDAALQELEDAQAAFDEMLGDLLDGNR